MNEVQKTSRTQTAIRLSDEILQRADKIAGRMSVETGLTVTRAEVLRIAISQGMAQLENGEKKRKKR
jgi:predicted transcriptional regulator